MLVAECLTALLFPFQWTLLYVPSVLTAALVCLDVPVPAIMGVRVKRSSDNSNWLDEDGNGSDFSDEGSFELQRCVVQIDQGQIQLPDDMPRFPSRAKFVDELSEIVSRFEQRTRPSEDWTHVDAEQQQPSQALSRLAAIAKRTGIVTAPSIELDTTSEPLFSPTELLQLAAKNCLRAAFVNRFAQLFSQIDAFICYPPAGKYVNVEQWLAQRSSTRNFDRTMFIADQPKPDVPFLLAFMETQSFVSFVDSKIASKFNEDHHLFGLSNKHLQVKLFVSLVSMSSIVACSISPNAFVCIAIDAISAIRSVRRSRRLLKKRVVVSLLHFRHRCSSSTRRQPVR